MTGGVRQLSQGAKQQGPFEPADINSFALLMNFERLERTSEFKENDWEVRFVRFLLHLM